MEKAPSIRREQLLTWLLPYATLVLTHLLVGANGYYPAIHPDEVIYREMARYFADVGPLPKLSDTFVFPIGYPLLIAPVFRLFESANALGFGLLLFNSLLASAVCFPVLAFMRRLGVSRLHAATSAVVVGVYPAYLVISGMALTQHAFVPLYAGLVVLAWRLYQRPHPALAAVVGAAAAALYAVHERALLVMAVVVAQVIFLTIIRHLRPLAAISTAATAGGGFFLVRSLAEHVHQVLYEGGGVVRPLSVVLGKLTRLDGWWDIFLQVCGQAWYLLLATYGLFGLGVAVLVKHLWARRGALLKSSDDTADAHGVLFLFATAGAIFGSCAIYFPENPVMKAESEFYYFGRINEGFLALFLAAGLAVLSGEKLRSILRAGTAVPLALAATFACGLIMIAGRGMEPLSDPGTYGVFGTRWFVKDETWLLHPLTGTAVMAAVAWFAFAALRRRPRWLLAGVALSYIIISIDLSMHYFGRRQQREYRRSLPHLVDAAGITSVSMDTAATRTGRWADMIRRVEVINFDDRKGERPPEPLVITRRRWANATRHRASFLTGDRDGNYGLWVMPGEEQRRLYRPPDPRAVSYGSQAIWNVWERGFSERELWRGAEPMRWTTGRVDMVIPLAGRSPSALQVDIAVTGQETTELEIEVNGRELFDDEIPPDGWARTLRLPPGASGQLLVQIESTRSRYPAWLYGSPRPYRRGVLIRGLHVLDAAEEAALAAPNRGGPLRYQIAASNPPETLRATATQPLVLVLELTNRGVDPWPGRLGARQHRNPQIAVRWTKPGETAEGASFVVEVARPVLPGSTLRQPIAIATRDARGELLRTGDYELHVALEWPDGTGAVEASEPLILDVEVRRPRARFFAPVRLLARNVHPSDPPFTLTPF